MQVLHDRVRERPRALELRDQCGAARRARASQWQKHLAFRASTRKQGRRAAPRQRGRGASSAAPRCTHGTGSPPPPRTKWTRLVHPSVLSGHGSQSGRSCQSHSPVAALDRGDSARVEVFEARRPRAAVKAAVVDFDLLARRRRRVSGAARFVRRAVGHVGATGKAPPPPLPPPSRTNWTSLVPPSVLTGHVSSPLGALPPVS